jgi:hypothetical protein
MQFSGQMQLRHAVLLGAALAAVGCSDPTASELGFRLQLNLMGTDTIRSRGEARTLEALVLNGAGQQTTSTVQFSVDRPDVIRLVRMNPRMVSLQSLVDGKARVIASFGDMTESIEVVVRRRVVRLQLLTCGAAEGFGMLLAGIVSLNPAVTDSIGHPMPLPAPVMYSSDDTTVVLVNMNGHAMGAAIGRTFVTGRLVLPESTFVARCYVSVWPEPRVGGAQDPD